MDILEKRLNISYIKLRFSLVFEQDTILPRNKVSALRGGMGEMMLQQNCIKDRNCKSCRFKEACIVHRTLYTKMEKKPAFMKCLVKRYSSTQNAKISLRGIQGYFYLDDIPEEYLLYILSGELLHIGKNSSFGFGRYQLF